eukprot:TRINITY_DN10647_c0_g1_i1.p1 TRINITY_DN10647_c0_g1~~TRINITY_DN10647_c0_g1_i1.p1  ORF type:complete len:416 (-),score=61.76 TRINITY_DN10647_c0_g1_i1:56-1303(-)
MQDLDGFAQSHKIWRTVASRMHTGPRTKTTIDQQTIRRRGVGLFAHDPKHAWNGYTFFAPMHYTSPDSTARCFLIDMSGTVVHEWILPKNLKLGDGAEILANGNVLVNAKIMQDLDRFKSWGLFKGGAVMELDWDSNILWRIDHPDHHHDATKLQNGNIALLCLREVPSRVVEKIQGGQEGTEAKGGRVFADYILEVTKRGEPVWEWRSWEHLDVTTDVICAHDTREEWTHGNTVKETRAGNLIVNFRNISTTCIIDRVNKTGDIIWKLGPPPLAQQHFPHELPNGNILLFDNGTHRADNPSIWSRVLEIERGTKRIVWQYTDRNLFNFFSPYISSAQRLPNGNTLICEGCNGRIFEVTHDLQVVWEYISPYFGKSEKRWLGEANWVFRAFRVSPAVVKLASKGKITPQGRLANL